MADDDPLAKFRRKAKEAQIEQPAKDTARDYFAFEAQDKVTRLNIRRTSGASHAPGYGYLLDIIYGPRFNTSFVMVYTFMTVTVKGRNLAPVVQAILMGKVGYLQEFHPELFDPPAEDAPLITSIEVVTGDRGAAMKEVDVGSRKTG